jgi:Kef-type K+ transport system membrane component KefB
LVRWTARQQARGQVRRADISLAFMALLLSSLLTELIGLHSLFGAFLLGALIPHDSLFARELRHRLEDVALMLLLPAFFAVTGMRTQIGLVSGPAQWALCGVLILVASLGKFGGCTLAARASGLDWRTSSTLGVLMNTRGLMELVVLNVALELGIFSPTLFAMLVVMALVTTFATTPLVRRLQRDVRGGEASPREGLPLASGDRYAGC